MVPSQEFIDKFCSLVKRLEQTLKENEYIGTHCTHGINRTGYLITYYMCSEKNISLKVAL
jgi:atypical dual specificity phosphatase